jgi:hypothetical protein
MATKTEMITFIVENSDEIQLDTLDTLSYKEVKKIYDKTELLPENATPPKNIMENLKLVSSEDYGDDGVGLSSEQIDELIFGKEEDEEVVEEVEWNYDDLSPNDKRLYRRTGIKRMSNINKYTRFSVEKPKL